MGSSHRSRALLPLVVLAVGTGACSVGVGEGTATGQVWAPECGLDGSDYSLNPNFFGADVPVNGIDVLEIRIQRGSDSADVTDGLFISIASTTAVHDMLGTPIDLSNPGPSSVVTMTRYLNETCPFGIGDPNKPPVAYVSDGGTITFTAIYAPQVQGSGKEIQATFDNVRFVAPANPSSRYALLSGDFRFIFSRGRPAQPFP